MQNELPMPEAIDLQVHNSANGDKNADPERTPTGKRRFKAFIREKLEKWRDRAPQDDGNRIPEVDNAVFAESDEVVRFPPSLSAGQRRMIHAIALGLDLFHASTGDGNERSVVVSRTGEFDAANVVPTATANVWYNAAVTKQKLAAQYFELINDAQHVARVRTYTDEIRAIVREPFCENDFQDVSWMVNVPDDLSGIPPLKLEDCVIVDTSEGLQELARELDLVTEFAFDLEMHNHRSYYGMTCTVQISANLKDYLVDAIKLWEHMQLLAPAFADGTKVKIGHAMGGGDVPALFRDFGIVIVNGVDTQEMAAALGDKQIGLAALLDRYGCKIADEVRIQKSVMQVIDWRTRPFTDDMVLYACGDVHYLLPLYAIMKKSILTMSEPVELGLGAIVDTLHENKEFDVVAATADGDTESAENATNAATPQEHQPEDDAFEEHDDNNDNGNDNDNDDDFGDGGFDTLDALDDPLAAEEDDDAEGDEDDEAMWEGWGVDQASTGDIVVTTEAEVTTEVELEQAAPPLERQMSRERYDSFSSHMSQPNRPARTAKALVVTPLGLDSYRRVCVKSAKHCLKLWAPKEVSEDAYTQVKGFALAEKSRAWEDKHTELFKRLFVWRERIAKEHDESPVYVLTPQLMIDIAKRMPVTMESLLKIHSPLPELLQRDGGRYAYEILEIVRTTVDQYKKPMAQVASADSRWAWWLATAATGAAIAAVVGVVWLRAQRR